MKMPVEQDPVYKMIDEILWKDWDPIGVNCVPGARDEYQSYSPQVFSLKMASADPEEIAEFLYKVETEAMGFSGSIAHCRMIANKISALSF